MADFPVGDVFEPIVADPKQPMTSLSFIYVDSNYQEPFKAALGCYAMDFGFWRREYPDNDFSVQFGMSGGLFAQFNLDRPSYDLLNADYMIGFNITARQGAHSRRLRLFHQSSHLGDELLISNPALLTQRINLSFEAVDYIEAYRWRTVRLYGGGLYAYHVAPDFIDPLGVQTGVEYYGRKDVIGSGRPIAGLDLKTFQYHSWSIDTSIKAGLEFCGHKCGQRRVRVLMEFYDGYVPYGQFYDYKMQSFGIGVYLGF